MPVAGPNLISQMDAQFSWLTFSSSLDYNEHEYFKNRQKSRTVGENK